MSDPSAAAARKAFDAIDNNNIPQAELFVENGLKKFPNNHALQAAEAFVLYRLGKRDAALDKATALAAREDLRDATAIDALAHVLQGLGGWSALTTLYQRVAQQLPDSLNAQENYFQALIRQGSFSDAQRVALSLHKKYAATTDGKYQAWTVMAMLAQVPADSKDHLQLKLATRMLGSSSLGSTEGCKAYVDVLMQQELYNDALQFLLSDRGEKVGLVERRVELVRAVLVALGRGAAAAAAARHLVSISSDNWKYYIWYLDAVTVGFTAPGPTEEIVLTTSAAAPLSSVAQHNANRGLPVTISASSVEQSLEDVIGSLLIPLQQLEMRERPNKKRRSPFLAELEVLKRLLAQQPNRAVELSARLRKSLVEYCKIFGTKPVCFMDIVPYLTVVGAPGVEDVIATCSAARGADCTPSTAAALLMLESKCRLMVSNVADCSDEDAEKQISDLVVAYREGMPLSAGLGWSEEGACDGFLSCAATLALFKFNKSEDKKWLVRVLEVFRVSERTLNNPSWLVLAVQAQRHLGLVNTAMTKQLDFKSVQFDSMRHLGYAPLAEGGAISDQEKWDSEAFKFYSTLGKDTSALRIKVFKFFTWPMWRDLLGFEQRLFASIGRVESIAAFALSHLRACQTQKELFAHIEAVANDIISVQDVVSRGAEAVTCNEDSTVLRAALVDDLHGDRCVRVANHLLVPALTLSQRLAEARDRITLFSVLHDHITREVDRQKKASAPRPNKKSPQTSVDAPHSAAPLLSRRQPPSETTRWPQPLRAMMPLLVQAIADGGSLVPPSSSQWTSAIDLTVSALTIQSSSSTTEKVRELQSILMPSTGYFLNALLQGACTDAVPVAKLAESIKSKCIEPWQALLKEATSADDMSFVATAVENAVPMKELLASFQLKKVRELQQLVADLAVCCTAASKRR